MKIGIEKIGFYTPEYVLDMETLAKGRAIPVEKLTIGLGQKQMSVPPIYEDAVTMAANAVNQLLTHEDKQAVDMILVGSESGVDQSKSIAVYLKSLCDLPEHIRAIEMKQACYGATMALQLAKSYLVDYPHKKVLIVASDIAKYGLNTSGELTQGAGAVAMLLSTQPKIVSINDESTYLTRDIMDFWRPNYSDDAFAQGKYSTEQYISFFEDVFTRYLSQTNSQLDDFAALCFHQPYTKLGLKALYHLLDKMNVDDVVYKRLIQMYEDSRIYTSRVGNIYTGSLYLGLLSLLENNIHLKVGDKIGLFSYGSGAVGEFFTMTILDNFKLALNIKKHQQLLANRKSLDMVAYEQMYVQKLVTDGSHMKIDAPSDRVVLSGMADHIRLYQK